jgi:hypothetical protein
MPNRVTLRYGQISSTIKTVSALQFYIAQGKGFFAREGINLEMLPIEGGAANNGGGVEQRCSGNRAPDDGALL